jgi:hypothetical protein
MRSSEWFICHKRIEKGRMIKMRESWESEKSEGDEGEDQMKNKP